MESVSTWEHKKLIDELTRGMETATRLRFHLLSTSPSEAQDLLMQRIVSAFENALSILKWDGPVGRAQADAPTPAPPDSSISADASPRSEDMNTNSNGDTPKKRKMQTTRAEQVRVSCENGLEGPKDDGYTWRKYGQKDILGAKHPRSYYRCTYRQAQSCWATKQVQRSDEDPTIFDITYKGTHTCNNQLGNAVSPEKQLLGENHMENSNIMRVPHDFSFPSTFPRADGDYSYFSIPGMNPPFSCTTAVTSESNYLSAVTCQMTSYVGPPMQHSETEIVSGHQQPTTDSPIGGMELATDLDPDFPFNIPSFFT